MRVKVCLVAALAIASSVEAQSVLRLGAPAALAWDYAVEWVNDSQVTRYEVQVDLGAWNDSGLPAFATVYEWPIPQALLTLGLHTARVRACNVSECGLDAGITFTVTPLLPPTPGNPRLVPKAVPTTTDDAVTLANAYGWIAFGRTLRGEELQWLSAQHTRAGRGLTVGEVLQTLDAAYTALVRDE